MKRTFAAISILALATHAHAGGPFRRIAEGYTSATTRQQAAAKADTGLVIVPFAVPVAVPVATVQQPSVLYSYKQYAEQTPVASAAASTPVPLPQEKRAAESVSPSSAASDAAAVLARHCASCHRGTAAQGNLALFDTDGSLISRLPRQAILEAVEQGRMPQPPTSTRLTSQELELLRTWATPPKDLLY